jgi:FAD/FMN-containing dehydrogenase
VARPWYPQGMPDEAKPDREEVAAALRTLLGADAVLTEPHELARYEQGWRYGQGKALAVARPSSTADVSRVLALASARGIRVVPQGGNTGLVGGSTPDASGEMLVLSLERLSRLLEIDPVDRTVTAGGGVLLSQLDAALAEQGLLFPIDLGAESTSAPIPPWAAWWPPTPRARGSSATATCGRTCSAWRSCSPTAP